MATETSSRALSILLIGGGELGTAILEGLVKHPKRNTDGHRITILLRSTTISTSDPAKKQQNEHLASLGAGFEAGDIANDSEADLANVFAKYDVVIGCAGFAGLPSGTQLRICRAIFSAGDTRHRRHLSLLRYFPWQWGLDYDVVGQGSAQDLFDEQLEVRKLLRGGPEAEQKGVDWVIVSTGLFMSFLFLPVFGPVDMPQRRLRALGSWENRVTVTTAKDIGVVTAELVFEPDDVHKQIVYVAGDTLSYDQLANMVAKRFEGPPLGDFEREIWGPDMLGRRLDERPDDDMAKYQNVFAGGRGVAWDMKDTVNYKRGIRLQDVESYMAEGGLDAQYNESLEQQKRQSESA